ncbi:RNA-binding, CRM domain [Dillenia turbinata]|uniref:RNA-binding, CRM domain n=1 Tax=Dillenia turbinata TaxID=194707 RepID=A0AAN8W2C0_9MAGN
MVGIEILATVSKHSRSSNSLNRFFPRNAFGFASILPKTALQSRTSLCHVTYQVYHPIGSFCSLRNLQEFTFVGKSCIHSGKFLNEVDKVVEPTKLSQTSETVESTTGSKPKRKKLKGKRAVVRWLKFFRWKKKKEFERMTAEEKILYKLRKAKRKEERLVQALKKIEPAEYSETTHDPEILTPEEHFFFLKMGLKCKNYVPVGRRGIYQGVILNMHLHWKKHQMLKVVVKTFSPEEVKEIAAELARLSGGIVLDIHEENTIIMYRGKNYSQPPTEIMSPRITLSRKKALDKSICRDGLRAVRRYIPRLQQDLELLQTENRRKTDDKIENSKEITTTDTEGTSSMDLSKLNLQNSSKLQQIMAGDNECSEEDDPLFDPDLASDSDNLSDIFETESDTEAEGKVERPLYLNEFEKFPVESDSEPEELEEHLRQVSESNKTISSVKDDQSPDFDEVDQIFLRAASLMKKKRR